MKVLLALVLAAAIGYFLGSLNFSIVVVKLMKGKDIRTVGSKNAGLTNTVSDLPAPDLLLQEICARAYLPYPFRSFSQVF